MSAADHWLLYGRYRLPVEFPDSVEVTVVRKPKMPVIHDPAAAVRDAIQHPSVPRSLPLFEVATSCRSACIAICDITRPVPNHVFLRPTLETLIAAGIPRNAITILVATGLHRPNIGDELRELIGDPWVFENAEVVNHDARCDRDHVDLGRTSTRGTPVKINRRFAEADVRIATGLVEPHFMAGYSGGRKVIAPGVAHADTIRTFHSHAFMANVAADNCNLDRNPLHEEQLQIVRMLGGAYAINTVIDEHRQLSFVNFGEITASHAAAVQFIEPYCRVELERDFRLVVTSAAGYPLDKTYYQTVKGMVGAIQILRPGGHLVIASECSEGIGSPEYIAAQKQLHQLGPTGFLNSIENKPLAAIDEWQTQMQCKAVNAGQIHLYSSLSAADRRLTEVDCVNHLNRTIADLTQDIDDRSVALIPEGPYVIPYYQGKTLH
jgi:nickel-dependent lactate racemase